MTATKMTELMNQIPFEPLEIHLNDGTKIVVEHPWQIATVPTSPVCVINDMDDRTRFVAYRNMTEVITATVPRQPSSPES